jgi:hypothetical protein
MRNSKSLSFCAPPFQTTSFFNHRNYGYQLGAVPFNLYGDLLICKCLLVGNDDQQEKNEWIFRSMEVAYQLN